VVDALALLALLVSSVRVLGGMWCVCVIWLEADEKEWMAKEGKVSVGEEVARVDCDEEWIVRVCFLVRDG
jgi:fatty acid desaturase